MKRAFDIFALGGKKNDAIDKNTNKLELPSTEPLFKRRKQFEMTSAQKAHKELFREVVTLGESGLEGEAEKAANFRWKKNMGIPIRKVSLPYPELKKKLAEQSQSVAEDKALARVNGKARLTRVPVIAHKPPKNKHIKELSSSLKVLPGQVSRGSVSLRRSDINQINSDVKRTKKKVTHKNKTKGGKSGAGGKKGKKK